MKRSNLVPAVRSRLKRFPAPYSNYFGIVPLPPTEEPIAIGSAQPEHSSAEVALGRADLLARQFPSHFMFSRVLVRQEAVASSDIEGTHSTLDALLEAEETDGLEATQDDILVRDYAVALERAIAEVQIHGSDAFTIHTIEHLHHALMRGDTNYQTRHGLPGEMRRRQVRIGGRGFADPIYNPPPYSDVLGCMAEQIAYLRCDGMQQLHQSVITQLAIAHAHFEAVHPFPDGNGRVGRLLLPLMLQAAGHTPLYLAPYILEFKSEYYDALRAAQQRLDYVPLIAHLSRAIVSSVVDIESAFNRLTLLNTEWLTRSKIRKNSSAYKLIGLLPGHPVITVGSVERLLQVSNPAAGAAINQLTAIGVLTERTGKKRNRIFHAREVLEIYKNPGAGT